MASIVLNNDINITDNRLMGLLTLAKDYTLGYNKAKLQAKDIAKVFNCSIQTVKRYMKKITENKDSVITNVESLVGKNGGYIITFDIKKITFISSPEALINTMNLSTDEIVKGIKEGTLDQDLKAEKVKEEKPTKVERVPRRKMREMRGKLAKELNEEVFRNGLQPTWKQFSRWENPESTMYGYLLGKLYSQYTWLTEFQLESTGLTQKDPHGASYSVFGSLNKLFGSAILTSFAKTAETLIESKINPVYYISSLFNAAYYQASTKHLDKLVVPFANGLLSEVNMKTFENMKKYDSNGYQNSPNSLPHETIFMQDNIFVNQLYTFFNLLINSDKTNKELAENIYQEQTETIDRLLIEGVTPIESIGDTLPDKMDEKVTRTVTAFMNTIQAKVNTLSSISEDSKNNFMHELGLLYVTSYKGYRNKGMVVGISDIVNKATYKAAKRLNNPEYMYTEDNEDILRPYEVAEGMSNFYHKAYNSMGYYDAQEWVDFIGDEIHINPHHYLGLNHLTESMELLTDSLGLSKMSLKEFYSIIELIGKDAIPFNSYNLLDIKQIVEKLNDKVKRVSYNDKVKLPEELTA